MGPAIVVDVAADRPMIGVAGDADAPLFLFLCPFLFLFASRESARNAL